MEVALVPSSRRRFVPTTSIMLIIISGGLVLGCVVMFAIIEQLAARIPEFDF